MELEPILDWSLARSIVLSLALGGIIGLERQRHHEPGRQVESIGVRTFALASLLATISMIAKPDAPALPYLMGGGYLLLILGFLYLEAKARDTMPGITTQVSALIVFVIGVMVPSKPVLAAVLAVIVASVLSVKEWTHRLVGNLSREEVEGTLKFLLVSVAFIPILPSREFWGVYNLQEIWLLVVLISGISFAGYFAIRVFGRNRGIALTGALGGLASSTAVTLAMCQRVKRSRMARTIHLAAAFAVLVASGIMTVRVILLVLAVSTELATTLVLPLVAMAIPGTAVAGWFWYRMVRLHNEETGDDDEEDSSIDDEVVGEDGGEELDISNPFELAPALKFGAIFVAIIGAVNFANQSFESSGTYVAAFLSGLANLDAISVALARMTEAGDVTTRTAMRGVVIAVLSNSFSKAMLSLILGSRRLGFYVAAGLVPTVAVGLAAIVFI